MKPAKITVQRELPTDAPENIRAQWWRQHIARLTRTELARRLGYTENTVYQIEVNPDTDRPAFRRFKRACGALHQARRLSDARLILPFNWGL